MSKIKVLHVHTLPVISGSGINVLLTMKGLRLKGYDVELATKGDGELIKEVEKEGFKVRAISHFNQEINLYKDIMALFELIYVIKKYRYDIVHTHNSKAGFIGRLAAKICGTPLVIHTVHGFAFHDFERPWRRKLFIFLERLAAKWADKLIVISNPLKDWGLRLGIGKKEQYVLIYSGIEIDKFKVNIDVNKKKEEFGIRPDELVVGVVAKLWEGKGHECVLKAVKDVIKKVPNVRFMFVGEGYLYRSLKELRDKLGLADYVIFTGFRKDIPEITSIFDVAVLASYFEGLGRVILEAMVCGKPVVATKVGGIVDIVEDAVTGLLVPPNNQVALSGALVKLLSNEDLRKKIGENAKKRIDERFSSQAMVDKIHLLYNSLIKQSK